MYFYACQTIECYKSTSYIIPKNSTPTIPDDEKYIVGDEKYNQNNRQILTKEDMDKIFKHLLETDITTDEGLLAFINCYGLPCSDAYATLDSLHEFYFKDLYKEYFPTKEVQSSISEKDFYDVCQIDKTRNSLLVLQHLASLKETCDTNNKSIKNLSDALYSILTILAHFHFEDLFIQLEEEIIEARTPTVFFIRHLFQPAIASASDDLIKEMLRKPITSREKYGEQKTLLFSANYNTKQCFQLFRLVKILCTVCHEQKIALSELAPILKSQEKDLINSIKKHMNLKKFHDNDLYNVTYTVFTDLLFEGLNLSVPTYEKNGNTIDYKLKLKTLLQGLYFHLYEFSGDIKRCANSKCRLLFESHNPRQKFCSESCSGNTRAKRYYDKTKKK